MLLRVDLVMYQFMNRTVVVIQQIHFTIVVFSESHHSDRRLNQFLARDRLFSVNGNAPHPTCFPITEKIHSRQFRKTISAINKAACHRCAFRVRDIDPRRCYRCGPWLPIWVHWLTPFEQAPAKVGTGTYPVHHFPQFPAHIGDPEFTVLTIETHLPWVPQSVSPYLSTCTLQFHKRVVLWNRIGLILLRVIHINP